jgi:hypothetical protein
VPNTKLTGADGGSVKLTRGTPVSGSRKTGAGVGKVVTFILVSRDRATALTLFI